MKVLFDHQAFSIQSFGGVSRYFVELMTRFSKEEYELALRFSDNQHLTSLDKDYRNVSPGKSFKGKSVLLHLLNKPNSIDILKEKNFDLMHPTYYNPYFLEYLNGKPFVLTVHDMTHELFPQRISRWDKSAEYKKILVEKAARIICVSYNTKKDLCRLLSVNENKIDVIHLASSLNGLPDTTPPQLPENYILYVGTRGYYKNFQRLFKAVQPLLYENPDLFLVCAGGGKFTKHELKKFSDSGLTKRIMNYNIDDDVLQHLYINAALFVLPSLYEGFGIPVVEAFNCNCPVVASNISSLPEIAGDASVYINPEDEVSILEGIRTVLNNPDIRNDLIEKGKKQRQKFSWDFTAGETKNVYEKL